MLLRPHRSPRSHRLTLLAAGAVLATPLLAGCGFNYATDRVNTISAGINDSEGDVDVLGAVVIAGQDDLGLFVATLVNKDQSADTELQRLEPTESIAPSETDSPVEIAAGGRTSLFQTGGIAVGGSFEAGDFVDVTLSFSNGQVTTVTIPVVTPCHQYSLDKLTELTLPEPAIDPGDGASEATIEPTEEDTAEADGEPGEYSCDPSEPIDPHAEVEPAE